METNQEVFERNKIEFKEQITKLLINVDNLITKQKLKPKDGGFGGTMGMLVQSLKDMNETFQDDTVIVEPIVKQQKRILSHYDVLSGSSPYSIREMKLKIVSQYFKNVKYYEFVMFDSEEYNKIDKIIKSFKFNWNNIYRSSSTQGYADIDDDGNIIKSAILNGGIMGAYFIKANFFKYHIRPKINN